MVSRAKNGNKARTGPVVDTAGALARYTAATKRSALQVGLSRRAGTAWPGYCEVEVETIQDLAQYKRSSPNFKSANEVELNWISSSAKVRTDSRRKCCQQKLIRESGES